MRKILAIAACLFFVPTTVWADTSFFPPYPIPVPATQGGTGQTSFTTNCVVAASSSTALTCTATPTISGANFTAATIPNAALVGGAPNFTTCTTWTPTDQSGASLAITVNGAIYCHTNNGDGTHTTYVSCDLTYPTTASGASAAISLPFNGLGGNNQALSAGYDTGAAIINPVIVGSTFVFYALGGLTQRTNALMSTVRILVSGVYQSST
jgi:hypothetical protein